MFSRLSFQLSLYCALLMNAVRSSDSPANTENHDIVQPLEYCQFETFRPRCWKNEVILIESARYGRMRTGKCLEAQADVVANGNDPQYIGCSVDVMENLDRKCTGSTQCDISITDVELGLVSTCYKGLRMYLEAGYICIQVVDPQRSCSVPLSSHPLHLMISSGSARIGCGTKTRPWMIEAPVGQKINMRLIDLSWKSSEDSARFSVKEDCSHPRGYILEKSSKRNVTICSGKERKTHLYSATGHIAEIILNHEKMSSELDELKYFIELQAIGCSDLVPPEDAWLKRSNNEAVIGCYSSQQTWQLRCQDQQWIGVVGNCSLTFDYAAVVTEEKETNFQVLAIVAISGIGVAICMLIICAGVVCIKQFSVKKETFRPDPGFNGKKHGTTDRCNIGATIPRFEPDIGVSEYPPTYAVYAGRSAIRCSDNPNNQQSTMNKSDNNAYFVLDQEAVAKECLMPANGY